jgi:hypothetical protein
VIWSLQTALPQWVLGVKYYTAKQQVFKKSQRELYRIEMQFQLLQDAE